MPAANQPALEFAEDLNNNAARIPFDAIARSTWDLMVETADEYYEPGRFTAYTSAIWYTPNR